MDGKGAVLHVTSGWCTYFSRPFPRNFQYRRLRFAYRAPSFFLAEMSAAGHRVGYLGFDEALELVRGSDQDNHEIARLDLMWITTHGEFRQNGYQFDLHKADLQLNEAQLGFGDPTILILDTCDAVDLLDREWRELWANAVGPNLRLVLGFSTPATVSETTSIRGRAFAQRALHGEPLASAWVDVATSTAYPGTDRAIAFALGDGRDDALSTLSETTLGNLPPARIGGTPTIVDLFEAQETWI